MEDKLRNLDKVMEKAVYQKKRFSDDRKQTVMRRIREQQKPSGLNKYARLMKPVLSLSVCIFLLVFAVHFILQPPVKEKSDGDLEQVITEEVTSLPLLNRISHLAEQDSKIIGSITVMKNDKHVFLNIQVVPDTDKKAIINTVENMFYKGSELYQNKRSRELNKIGAPWNDYTVDISVVENIDRNVIYDHTQNQPTLIRGVKPTNQDHITWID